MTHIETITTRIERDNDERTIQRLQNRGDELNSYGRSGYTLASTITVPSGEYTVIVDTLTKNDLT
ncbi:MAG: hypothetical protein KF727_15310 [Microbacteriaceae bacterium]|nr:hypothetical protein [Microbacteriaceae bacterium]